VAFTGTGNFGFSGVTSSYVGSSPGTKTFNVAYNFTVPAKILDNVVFVLNEPVHFSNLIWNGGTVMGSAPLVLDQGMINK
jgi:hypothetical protein